MKKTKSNMTKRQQKLSIIHEWLNSELQITDKALEANLKAEIKAFNNKPNLKAAKRLFNFMAAKKMNITYRGVFEGENKGQSNTIIDNLDWLDLLAKYEGVEDEDRPLCALPIPCFKHWYRIVEVFAEGERERNLELLKKQLGKEMEEFFKMLTSEAKDNGE